MNKNSLVSCVVSFGGLAPQFARRPLLPLAVSAVILCSGSTQAATDTWTGLTDSSWATPGNWSPVAVPANGDTALFNGTGAGHTAVAISAATTINSITFDTSSAAAYTLGTTSGGILSLQSGGAVQTTSSVANIETINSPIKLLGSSTFTSGAALAANTLNFGGTITNGATSTPITLTLNGSNSGANTISGIISNGAGASTTSINQTAGNWVLSGANTFNGTVTVASGATLTTTSAAALGGGGNTLALNGTLNLNANNTNLGNLSGTGTITNTSGSATSFRFNGTTGQFDGNIVNGTSTMGVSNSGTGTLTLTGNNTYTGGTNLGAGSTTIITQLANTGGSSALGYWGGVTSIGINWSAGATQATATKLMYKSPGTNAGTSNQFLVFGNSTGGYEAIDSSSVSPLATLTLTGTAQNQAVTNAALQTIVLQGTNTGANNFQSVWLNAGSSTAQGLGSIIKAGSGTWQLSGANTYGGGTLIQAGTLMLGSSSSGAGTTSPLGTGVGAVANHVMTSTAFNGATVSSGAVLDLNGQAISQAIVLNGTGISSAGALINNSGTAATISGGGVTGLQITSGGSGYSSVPSVTLSGNATAVASLGLTTASLTISGGTGYTVGSAITVTGGGGSGFRGTVTSIGAGGSITGWTVTAPGTGFTGAPTSVTVATGTGASTSINGNNFTVSGLTVTSQGSGYTSAPSVTFAGSATASSYVSGVILGSNSSIGGTGNITISGLISDSGSNYSLTKVGANTVTLGSANSYGGGTIINAGTINFSGAGTLGGTSASLGVAGGTLNLSATSQTVGAVSLSGGTISNGTLTGTSYTTSSGTITANLAGSGVGLTQNGAGTTTLSGSSTYSGGTLLTTGTLVAGSSTTTSAGSIVNGPFGTGTLTLGTGTTLEDNGSAITLANALSLSGTINLASTGSGSLIFDGHALTVPSTVTLTGNTTLNVTNTTTIADDFTNPSNYSLAKAGAGTLNLTGTTTSTAGTTITGGLLTIASGNSLGSGLINLANGAGLAYTGGTGTMSQNITVASGATATVSNTGTATLTLAGTLTKADANLILNAGGNTIDVMGRIVSTGAVGPFDSDLYVTNGTVIADNSNNTYTGATHLYGNGTLVNGLDDALPASTVIALGNSGGPATESGASYTNTYQLNGHNQTIAGLTTANPVGFTDVNRVIGGSATLSTLTITGTGTGTLGGGTLGGAGTNANNLAVKFNSTSPITLTGGNTYSGGTEIQSGTLIAANGASGSASGTGSLLVDSGATLAGSGTINSTNNTINGNVTVGSGGANTTDVLTMTASGTTVFSGAALSFNLDAVSTNSNVLALGSTPNVYFGNGTTTLTLNMLGTGSHDIASGTEYILFTASSAADYKDLTFSGGRITNFNLTLTGLASNGQANSVYYGDSYLILNGANIEILVVPEPGTWALMLGGLVLLVSIQRVRRSRNC